MTLRFSLGSFIFYTLIGIQVAAAIFAIRIWPITDYPMFSQPVQKFDSMSRLSIESVFKDYSKEWTREDYRAVGLKDHRLQSYADNPFHPRVLEILAENVKLKGSKQNDLQALRIHKLSFYLNNDNKFTEKKEMVREIPYAELIK